MEVFEAIRGRSSIRKYEDKEVPEDLLEKVLDAARWAPSWANTQCQRFVVVRDAETREKLMESLSSKNPARKAIANAPVVIVGCAKRGVSGYYKGKAVTEKEDWYMFDSALAMQNLMLAAYALGLGTVQVGYFNSKEVEDLLEVPEDVTVVSMTPLGFPAKVGKRTSRKELDDIVYYEKYEK